MIGRKFPLNKFLFFSLSIASLAILSFIIFKFWNHQNKPLTLQTELDQVQPIKDRIIQDFNQIPTEALQDSEDGKYYQVKDDQTVGLEIHYSDQQEQKQETDFSINLPKDYTQPIEIKLDNQRSIFMEDKNSKGISTKTLTKELPTPNQQTDQETKNENQFIKYQTKDERKSLYYGYQKEQTSGERKLKNWLVYKNGNGHEEEAYAFKNAKLKLNQDGEVEVFYFSDQDQQNQQAMAEVDPSLLERAQKVVAEDLKSSNSTQENQTPDFVIPRPFFIDKYGTRDYSDWLIDDVNNTIAVELDIKTERYPIALDPTLSFAVPMDSSSVTVINGEGNYFSMRAMAAGDFNADGKMDLAVGLQQYNSNWGRTYIFYNDETKPMAVLSADVIITGEASSNFGAAIVAGDFNADSKIDLAVGADVFNTYVGRAYIFYNDGIYTDSAASADVVISGESSSYFGNEMAVGDFNADGKNDLIIGGYGFNSNTGRAYIFYQNSGGGFTTPLTAAANTNVYITGETNSYFGVSITTGDFNSDGKNDLVVGASGYSSSTGRVYIFYQNSGGGFTTPLTAAANANVYIQGQSYSSLGVSMVTADINADGKKDLVVGASGYNTSAGRVYIFYQNSGGGFTTPLAATSANVVIDSEGTTIRLGESMASGDFNNDGRIDLAVSAKFYSSQAGRTYIFYNDGSIPTTAAAADVIITGEAGSLFGSKLTTGDFNSDSKDDLIVVASGYNSNQGRVYIFYSQTGQSVLKNTITGGATANHFGESMYVDDFNSDGKDDLVVGAWAASTLSGRTYIFYNDGSFPAACTGADVIINGSGGTDSFGGRFKTADINNDGKKDLLVSATGWSVTTGRIYIFYQDSGGGFSSFNGSTSASANHIIGGQNGYFGWGLEVADIDNNGREDIIASAPEYDVSAFSYDQGRAYIFYNDGTLPTAAASADVIITGSAADDFFGRIIVAGNFGSDGRIDFCVGSDDGAGTGGRAYIFYNDGAFPTLSESADVRITSQQAGNLFGGQRSMDAGDFNNDGKLDLVMSAAQYDPDPAGTSSAPNTGRAYVFYQNSAGGFTATIGAASANAIIQGEGAGDYFGNTTRAVDFNNDGRMDFVIGAYGQQEVYGFANDGSYPTLAANAELNIANAVTNFGLEIQPGDLDNDGYVDLAIGGYGYNSDTGQAFIYSTYKQNQNYSWQTIPQKDKVRTTPIAGQEIVLSGEATGNYFGSAMVSGDFDGDRRMDLAVGAYQYSSGLGRVYLFFNDGVMQSADSMIDGASAAGYFGRSLAAGDFDFDGDTDLAVGADGVSTNAGAAYLFYNKGLYPVSASDADLTITGEASSHFGYSLSSGDFDNNGRVDLAAGAYTWNSTYGRAYVFNNDGSYPTTAATANAIITGESGSSLGYSMINGPSADFNNDGKTDLLVATPNYSGSYGRAYIFYGGSVVTEAATGADIIITGEASSSFGTSSTAGDFNNDGKIDLAVGASYYSSFTGRTYVFYGGSIITEAATGADVIITGEASSRFGHSLISGDFNFDGKTDLAAGAEYYSSNTGRVYVFNNDGSIPTTAATADLAIAGEASSFFGCILSSGDFNSDGHDDLAIGAYGYNTNTGKVSIYTFNDSATFGEYTSDRFGYSLISGDFNSDGNTDLAIGAYGFYYSGANAGKVYIFYGLDRKMPISPAASNADSVINGYSGSQFGYSLSAGDYNSDGKTDLAIGMNTYGSNNGIVFIYYQPSGGGYSATIDYSSYSAYLYGSYATKFGKAIASADFNSDGKTDLAVSENEYSTNAGRVYVFNQNSAGGFTAAIASTSANYFINGEASSQFGYSLIADDFNADGKTDLIVGAIAYSSNAGRAYVFHQNTAGGFTTPLAATSANTIINGEASSYFGSSLATTDFNADGKKDLAVGASAYNSSAGRAYIFSNDGSIPTTAATADIKIDGESSSGFGGSMVTLDINVDGKADLIIGGSSYSTNTGRVYVFHNRGTDMIQKMPTSATNADMFMTGETTSNYFSAGLTTGDINNDGESDLIVGASGYNTNTGKVYTYATEASYQSNEKSIKFQGTSKYQGTVKFQ
jgi:formylmethanofuran dehydrogenase subunit C